MLLSTLTPNHVAFMTIFCHAHREEATPAIPPELQAAIDAGKEDEVKDMLAKVPETWSKSLKKKLQKDAQIAAKKIAKVLGDRSEEMAKDACPRAFKAL